MEVVIIATLPSKHHQNDDHERLYLAYICMVLGLKMLRCTCIKKYIYGKIVCFFIEILAFSDIKSYMYDNLIMVKEHGNNNIFDISDIFSIQFLKKKVQIIYISDRLTLSCKPALIFKENK